MTIEEEVRQINHKVSSILQLIKGHEFDQDDKGMVGIQNEHEDRLLSVEKLIANGKYFLFGISIPAGWGLIDIIQKLIL